MKKSTFAKGVIIMLLASGISLLGYNRLYKNQARYLLLVEQKCELGQSLTLDPSITSSELSQFLVNNNYLKDKNDADAIATHFVRSFRSLKNRRLKSLDQLNTRDFRIPCNYIDSVGGETLRQRLEESRNHIGVHEFRERGNTDGLPIGEYRKTDSAACQIVVKVRSREKLGIAGVPVRLKRHYYDEIEDSQFGVVAADSIITYVRTGANGKVVFYVEPGNYSVVPVEPGYEFGMSKGSTHGQLEEGLHVFTFDKHNHSINAFSPSIYKDIKRNDALTVRTPEYYKRLIGSCFAALLVTWWISFIVIGIFSRRKSDGRDMIIIPVVMFLNVISVLVLFGMSNPLTDRLLGADMTYASVIGVVTMTLLSFAPVARIYSSGYRVFNRKIPFEPILRLPKGISYLLLSLLLMVLLALFGSAPEGSDAKIYLFFLQPSELCKLLTVIFMAAFFAEKSDAIRRFAERTNKISFYLQLRTTSAILAAIFVLSMMYMGILSDMGPALVLLITFILMYSFARRDFLQLLLGIVSFFATLCIFNYILTGNITIVIAALTWGTIWIMISLLWKKTIYESAIFFNLLITLFMTGGSLLNMLGFKHQAARLLTRMAMFGTGIWDNNISTGGDQVAQAIWGYSTGGFAGQGLGFGNSNLIPAGHTDMILASVGEQLGLIGIIVVLVCVITIPYRSYIDGRNSGNPFSFYLATGIGSVIVIQFFIISLGSIGLVPLTGMAVPFLSYAKSSIVFNLAAIGIVIAISKENAGRYQRINMESNKRSLKYGFLSYLILGGILVYTLSDYMVFCREDSLLHPGTFSNPTGLRTYHYNPRIKVLEDKLKIETIYDRNGLPLASSSKEEVKAATDNIIQAGISPTDMNTTLRSRSKRYYPFGMHTFFMVGDYNNKIQWTASANNPYGFNAENLFLSKLRGFNNQHVDNDGKRILNNIDLKMYRPSRFLPAIDRASERREMMYDYGQLLPLLKQGIAGHREIQTYDLNTSKAVHLTLDAHLQTALQNRMRDYIINDETINTLTKLRVSVVVLEGKTGDLLCSANYPLPQFSTLDSLEKNAVYVYNEKDSCLPAYTDRDLGLTYQTHPGSTAKIITALAGYHKYGNALSNTDYKIDLYEIIENGKIREPYSAIGGKSFRNKISMTEAIVSSSNCYFINLLADKNLYTDLAFLYETVGIRLDGHEGRGTMIPYFFYNDKYFKKVSFEQEMAYLEAQSRSNYVPYKESGRSGVWHKMNRYYSSADYWGIAYGQGELYASPLNIARIGTIVANDGDYVQTRYELSEPIIRKNIIPTGTVLLGADMKKEADKHRKSGFDLPENTNRITFLSKTGTPERTWMHINSNGELIEEKPNDGWYLFVVKNRETEQSLSIAIRMERLGAFGSRTAVQLAADVVIPTLQQCGYQIY